MKKLFTFKRLSLATLLLAIVLVVVYRAQLTPPSEELAVDARMVAMLEQGGCLSCHQQDAELPLYANLPVVGKVVKEDIAKGYHTFDIMPLYNALKGGEKLSPVDVAKVEKVVMDGTMPAAKYYLMHWGSQSTKAKGSIAQAWAEEWREAHYNDGLGGEPIRPIAEATNVDEKRVALGFKLYHDTRLSVDNSVSCATCHDLSGGGVDNHQYSHGVNDQLGGVNAPTVYNATYNFVQFWDGRAMTLEAQAAGPPLNPIEMASASFDEIIAKLNKDAKFVAEFKEVYPEGFTEQNITNAIAAFERTLVTPNSQFDKWLRGDDAALNEQEKRGYELFKEYSCATCHVGANLGGESYELMGVYHDYFADRDADKELQHQPNVEDNGRNKETKLERDIHRFKTPGLRNVELTWPYFHDGTRPTLEEAVRDMAYYQVDKRLNEQEINDIVAFLRTLTGEYQGKKLTTPYEYGVTLGADHDHDHHHHDHDHDHE